MHLDDTLRDIIDSLQAELQEAGLVRTRGGMARGKHWAECAGRRQLPTPNQGDWLELRLYHDPTHPCLRVELLAYQPLTKGGRTLQLGAPNVLEYRASPLEVAASAREIILVWLDQLKQED